MDRDWTELWKAQAPTGQPRLGGRISQVNNRAEGFKLSALLYLKP